MNTVELFSFALIPFLYMYSERLRDVTMVRAFSFILSKNALEGTNRICEQQSFRQACEFVQSRQNLRCSLTLSSVCRGSV